MALERLDLNLLFALDVLLTEGSVLRAARQMKLSSSAMSRTLARLREATGDPLLVRAGRDLVPTPRAKELRERVHRLAHEVRDVLRPASDALDLRSVEQTFTIRANASARKGDLVGGPPSRLLERFVAVRPTLAWAPTRRRHAPTVGLPTQSRSRRCQLSRRCGRRML